MEIDDLLELMGRQGTIRHFEPDPIPEEKLKNYYAAQSADESVEVLSEKAPEVKPVVLKPEGGYDRVFLIDSVMTGDGKPGDWYSLSLDDLVERRNGITSHTINLRTVKEMGRELGETMPEIRVYAIEVKEPFEFGENLTQEVEDSLEEVISGVLKSIKEEISDHDV